MGTYRKKPVEIEARQMPDGSEIRRLQKAMDITSWMVENGYPWLMGNATEPNGLWGMNEQGCGIWIRPSDGRLMIRTLEGDMAVDLGDWVIRGVNGEFYPCKPDIFEKTYEERPCRMCLESGCTRGNVETVRSYNG